MEDGTVKKIDGKLITIITITLVLIATLLIGYDLDLKRQLKIVKLDKNIVLGDNNKKIQYKVEGVDATKGICNINCWAVIKGTNSYNIIPTVILKGQNGDLYKINTRITRRVDITKFFIGKHADENTHLTCITENKLGVTKDKNVYDNSGIVSQFKTDSIKRNTNYKIGIQLRVGTIHYFFWTNSELKL